MENMFVYPLSEFDDNINTSFMCTLNMKLESEYKGKQLKVTKFAFKKAFIILYVFNPYKI